MSRASRLLSENHLIPPSAPSIEKVLAEFRPFLRANNTKPTTPKVDRLNASQLYV